MYFFLPKSFDDISLFCCKSMNDSVVDMGNGFFLKRYKLSNLHVRTEQRNKCVTIEGHFNYIYAYYLSFSYYTYMAISQRNDMHKQSTRKSYSSFSSFSTYTPRSPSNQQRRQSHIDVAKMTILSPSSSFSPYVDTITCTVDNARGGSIYQLCRSC